MLDRMSIHDIVITEAMVDKGLFELTKPMRCHPIHQDFDSRWDDIHDKLREWGHDDIERASLP